MKSKIVFLILLAFFFVLGGLVKSYAGEARAYASIVIIIPAKEATPKTESSEEKLQEEGVPEKEQLYAQDKSKE